MTSFSKGGQNKTILFKSASTGFDMWRNKAHECKGGQRICGDKVVDGGKKTKRFGEEGMNLLPCGEAHVQEVTVAGGCGRERAKSDRLACESTHRRTLFNVSLTFLFSISDPRSLEERAERKS